jgi:mannose-6-phosphate isomerase
MTEVLYPLLLTPSLHVKVWGGRKLASEMGKPLIEDAPYGEAWELHDSSVVANGALAGKTLRELTDIYRTTLLGEVHDPAEGLPLLIKLLDASDWLSVQVHPNDEQARELEAEPRGKTEAWIILATEPNAELVIGVKSGSSRKAMAQAIVDGTLEEMLVYAKVQPGDVLYMPANTIHAIGPGILLYEVQQSSDVTYRLYDWNRMGLDGKPREMHIEKGVKVSNVDALPTVSHPTGELMVDGEYFQTKRHRLNGDTLHLKSAGHFQAITCIEGLITILHPVENLTLSKGQTGFIAASLGDYTLSGEGVVLRSYMVMV